MILIRTLFATFLLASGINLLIIGNMQSTIGQTDLNINEKMLKSNSINLTEPIYQAITGTIATKELSSTPYRLTEESVIENAVMKNVGNVTNSATFTNIYFSDRIIQGQGKGTIKIQNNQTINWISSDIGMNDGNGLVFHGIILFNNTSSEKLSFLNNAVGVYKNSPGFERTIWLLK